MAEGDAPTARLPTGEIVTVVDGAEADAMGVEVEDVTEDVTTAGVLLGVGVPERDMPFVTATFGEILIEGVAKADLVVVGVAE